MLTLASSVTAPAMEALPEVTTRAPFEPTPAPLTFKVSAPITVPFVISSVAPPATLVPPKVAPSAALLLATKVPTLIVVRPVWVFAPLRISVPAPVLVRAVPETTPLKVSVPVPPIVLAAPIATVPPSDAVPVPVKAPLPPTPVPSIVSPSVPITTPLMSSVAPELTVVAPAVVPSAFACCAVNVPALTVVNPV